MTNEGMTNGQGEGGGPGVAEGPRRRAIWLTGT